MPQRFSMCGDMIIENFKNLDKANQAEYLVSVYSEIQIRDNFRIIVNLILRG